MSLLKTFLTICASDGSPIPHWRDHITDYTGPCASGYVHADVLNPANTAQLVIIDGQPILIFSTEAGECYRWAISRESLRGIVLDGAAELLKEI